MPITSTNIVKETSEYLGKLFFDYIGARAEWFANVNSNNQAGTLVISVKFQYMIENTSNDANKVRAIQSKVKEVTTKAKDDLTRYNEIRYGKSRKNSDIFLTDDVKSILEDFVPDQIAITDKDGRVVAVKTIKNNKGEINWDLITRIDCADNPYNQNQKYYEVIVSLDGLRLYKEILCHGYSSIIQSKHIDYDNKENDKPRISKYDNWDVQLIREFEQEQRIDVYNNGVAHDINVIRMKAILMNKGDAKEVGKALNMD